MAAEEEGGEGEEAEREEAHTGGCTTVNIQSEAGVEEEGETLRWGAPDSRPRGLGPNLLIPSQRRERGTGRLPSRVTPPRCLRKLAAVAAVAAAAMMVCTRG